jgi:branched-subunit amino acid permease
MLRLRAFRPTPDKVVRLLLHPTYPWLVTADASDNVVVWDWEHRQVSSTMLYSIISVYPSYWFALLDIKLCHQTGALLKPILRHNSDHM